MRSFSRRDAAQFLKVRYAQKVVAGVFAPREGAALIVGLSYHVFNELPDVKYAGDGFGIAVLLGNYYAYDDIEEGESLASQQISRALFSECQRIVAEASRTAG